MFRVTNRFVIFCSNYTRKNDKKNEYRIGKFFLAPLSRNCQHFRPYTSLNCSISKIPYISSHHLESFRKMKNDIIDELLNYNGYTGEYRSSLAETMPLAAARLRKLMEENLIMWEYARAMMMIRLCEEFVKYESNGSRAITVEEYQKIYKMGWCFELLETYSIMHDDIIDNADMRKGKATWYRQNNNHAVAIQDQFLLNSAVRLLFDKYFVGQPYYYNVQEILTGMDINYLWGTMMDILLAKEMWPNQKIADTFLWDLYKRRAYYVDTCYFSAPMKLAMHMVNKYDEKTAAQIDRVSCIFGIIFQSFDDYLDSYGVAQQKEKPCNDIGQGTRSFLAVLAYKYADQHQRNILLEHYGKNNADSIAAVKEIYRQLDLESKYQQQEKLLFRRLNDEIANIDNEAVRNVFYLITDSLQDWHN